MRKKVVSTLATTIILTSAFAGTASANTYKVIKGDSLSHISKKYHIHISDLKKANNLHSDFIRINQVLKIPIIATKPAAKIKVYAATTVKKHPLVQTPTTIYTVVRGDSLSKIAKHHGITLSNLKKLNNLKSNLIHPGQKLKITGKVVKKTPKVIKDKPKSPAPAKIQATYVVQSGDTLEKIGFQTGMSVADLKKVNNLSSDLIFVGQLLKVAQTAAPENKAANNASTIIKEAKNLIGIPYAWGGSTNTGFDCSGFVYYVQNKVGNPIGRYSADGYYNRSYYVDKPQPGDLVFFENTYKPGISHMGIYLGDNQFIHADEKNGITITSLNSAYYQEHLDGFKRFY